MAMPFTHTGVNTRADGRQRLLDAAVRWLETASETDFRMSAIAAEADVTIALITHHFGSREGLIMAAQQVRVAGSVRQDIQFMNEVLVGQVTAETFRSQLNALITAVLSEARAPRRLSRVAALAAAHGRDTLKDALSQEIALTVSALAETVNLAQLRGFMRSDIDPRATAVTIQALLFGYVLADLDNSRTTWNEMRSVTMLMLESLLLPATPQSI